MISRVILRWSSVSVIVVLLAALMWGARDGLYPFVIAILLSYFLSPAVERLEQYKLTRAIALMILYTIGGGVLCLVMWKGIPIFLREIEAFAQGLPQISAQFEEIFLSLDIYQAERFPPILRHVVERNTAEAKVMAEELLGELIHRIVSGAEYAVGAAVSPIIAFYLLYDWRSIRQTIFEWIPAEYRHDAGIIAREINRVLSGVIRGQVIISMFVSAAITFGLYYLDVPYAILLGILAGILDVIPYFGAIFGAVPAILFGLLISPMTAFKVAVLFVIVHQLESSVIHPKIIGDSIGMHPLAVLFFVFLGGEAGGLIGMIVGVPFAAIGKIIFHHIMRLTA